MQKNMNMLENLPSELLDKLIECVNNKIPLSMSSKRLKEFFNKKDEVFYNNVFALWIQENKKNLGTIMWNFKHNNAKKSWILSQEQKAAYQSMHQEQDKNQEDIQQNLSDPIFDDIDIKDTIKELLDKHRNEKRNLKNEHIKALCDINNKQSQILWDFNTDQRKAFNEFDKEPEINLNAIEIFLCQQTDAIKKLHLIQNDNIIKLQSEHNTSLLELQFKQNYALSSLLSSLSNKNLCYSYNKKLFDASQKLLNAIKKSQSIQDNNIIKLEFEQMKATRELQFNQYEKTREYNTKHVNYTYSFLSAVSRVTNGDCTVSNRDSRVSQQANCTASITENKININMIDDVKTIIHNVRINDPNGNGMEKLTQYHLNCSIIEVTEEKFNVKRYIDDEYNRYIIDIEILKIIIFLYLTKETNFELDLDFDLINYPFDKSRMIYEYNLNNEAFQRCFKYFTIIFPKLNNLTKLRVHKEDILSLSLELFKLLLLLPTLQSLYIKIIPIEIDFELPEQKLQINDLVIEIEDHSDNGYYNIHTILEMCPCIFTLKIFDDYCKDYNSYVDNKYLVKLAKILNKCNNLTDFRINTCTIDDDDDDDDNDTEEQLDFIPVLLECPNLTKLDLSTCNIQNNSAINIAKILSKSSIFTHLNLSYNNISSGIEIVKILSKSISLSHLDLSNNDFEDEEKKKIREILSHNQRLKLLL